MLGSSQIIATKVKHMRICFLEAGCFNLRPCPLCKRTICPRPHGKNNLIEVSSKFKRRIFFSASHCRRIQANHCITAVTCYVDYGFCCCLFFSRTSPKFKNMCKKCSKRGPFSGLQFSTNVLFRSRFWDRQMVPLFGSAHVRWLSKVGRASDFL